MYPVWKDGDPRFRNCWSGEAHSIFSKDKNVTNVSLPDNLKMLKCTSYFSGGEVTFNLKNDGPTLTGARATFSINLNFPPNQTVLPDGQVVWAQNCTINGKIAFSKNNTHKQRIVMSSVVLFSLMLDALICKVIVYFKCLCLNDYC